MKRDKKISICITVKNRSKFPLGNNQYLYLFPRCVESITNAIQVKDNIEIVISDWHSTDWPLEEWIDAKLSSIPYKIIKVEGRFHRGTGRNVAADNADGDYLWFIDADMIINRRIFQNGLACVRNNKAYFPSCFYFLNPGHTKGFWCGGKGNCMLTREMYLKIGKWPCPPQYNRPYHEDIRFFKSFERSGFEVVTEKVNGYLHQYHPGMSVDEIFTTYKELVEVA